MLLESARMRYRATTLAFVLLMTLTVAPGADVPWYKHYQRGIDHILAGEAGPAHSELQKALALEPEPRLQVPTYGPNYVDYLPHLYLAIAAQMLGDPATARGHLKNAEGEGIAAQSEAGRSLLEASHILLQVPVAAPPVAPPPIVAPRYSVFERQPTVLTDEDYTQVKGQVLDRCQLDEDTPLRQAPWYLHYEMGLELVQRGDPQRALDAFIEATERRHTSKRKARIYGMWFKDYLPYYQIARTHSMLGNWECAADALDVSRSMGEIQSGDAQYGEFEKFGQQVRGRVGP